MTTRELELTLLELEFIFAPYQPFIQLLKEIDRNFHLTYANIDVLAQPDLSPDYLSKQLNELRKQLGVLRAEIMSASIAEVFVQTNQLAGKLKSLREQLVATSESGLDVIRDGVIKFQEMFETLIKKDRPFDLVRFALSATQLYVSISATYDLAQSVRAALYSRPEIQPEEDSLTIHFSSSDTSQNVAYKILAINEIYMELCVLLDVSAAEHPLRLARIDAGTWWGVFIGRGRVIKLVGDLIKSAIGFVHRNFTDEGRLDSIPRQIEAAERVLGFSEKLQEAGVDTTAIKDQLQKATFSIAAKLNILVIDEATLEVNDEKFSVAQGVERKFLQESKKRLLGEGDEREEP
ncbi:MAG: hypothetical protein ACJ754_10855 [Pyrinomonadaceae bacterium]